MAVEPRTLAGMETRQSSPAPALLRVLGPWTATAIVVGTIIGSGIFKKPQDVADRVPYFGLAIGVWVVGGLLTLLGALALGEVAVLFPRAGGNYVFLREGFGRRTGFLWGWVEFWIIRGASLAALATIFAESLRDVLVNPALRRWLGLPVAGNEFGFWPLRGLTVAVLVVLALVNVRGVRWGGYLQLVVTVVKVATLVGIMVLPFAVCWLAAPVAAAAQPTTDHWSPIWPEDWAAVSWGQVGAALVGVLFAYHGWMNVAPVAEEVRSPQRNLPRALLLGSGIVLVLYVGANLAYYLVIPRPEMAMMKESPVSTEFSLRLLGPIGAAVASAAVMMSTFGALNGNLLVGPRVIFAMGDDGLAPRFLAAIHARFHTPSVAILVTATWSAILVLAVALLTELGALKAGKNHFNILTDFAMFGAVCFETLAVATIFVFRRRLPQVPRPYRCPGYPVVPFLYVVVLAAVLVNMFWQQTHEALIGLGFIALGAVVYPLMNSPRIAAADRSRPMGFPAG
ncbi:MAG: amino acid permease [Gemmataceae bacterium]|nr:amino acid permease [Gemmataceae bacterium]MDW8263924.1 amino acid permease [Gemmataceae bacterium]